MIALILIVSLFLITLEVSIFMVLGFPRINIPKDYLSKQIKESKELNSYDSEILQCPNGYFTTCGVGITGTLYYRDDITRDETRIPWWANIYKEHKIKVRELKSIQEAKKQKERNQIYSQS